MSVFVVCQRERVATKLNININCRKKTSEEMTEVPLEQCKDFINENYVKKLLEFLRGESKRVTTNKEYMKVY